MTPKLIGTLLTLVSLLSCNKPTSSNEYKIIEIKNYSPSGELKDVYRAKLLIAESNDSIIYNYIIKDMPDFYKIGIKKGDDSELTHFKEQIPIVARKTFKVDSVDIEIKKYDFDMPDEVDEEEYVYFIADYGVIAIKGHGWIYTIHFDDGGQFGRQTFKLLQADTTGFYGKSLKISVD